MILVRAPMRVSLFGGGSDHPEHFLTHGGAVLGMAIDKYVYVGVKRMPPGQIGVGGVPIRYRVQYSHVDDCVRADDVQHPAVRAALRYLAALGIDEPTEFHCFADLPGRSGLGGSSSFAVGLLRALQAHYRLACDGAESLAREALSFERHLIQEAGGFQDQIFAALGGIQHIRFGAGTEITPVTMVPERLQELERSLVLVYTGAMRDGHAMAAKQIDRVADNERLLAQLTDLTDVAATAMRTGVNLHYIGSALDSAWRIKRRLHQDISSLEIDRLYSRGLSLGALGGKLCGAGGGGFMLFWVPVTERERFEREIGMPTVTFKVAPAGAQVLVNEP